MDESKAPAKTKATVIALVISIVACSFMLGGAIYVRVTEEDALRAGLVEGCKKAGNPLRKAVRGILEDEIVQSEKADLHQFFPQIPPKLLDELIAEQNERRQGRIDQLHPIDCDSQYK